MHWLISIAAIAAAIVGFLSLSEATFGVGLIGIAAVLGILARIAQAGDQHHQLIQEIRAMVAHNEVRPDPLEK